MKTNDMLNNRNIILSKITKQHVYNAAAEYIKFGLIPTQKLIKQRLGKGSNSTIHKYLKQWFLGRLQKTDNLNITEDCNNIVTEENQVLQKSLNRQIKQNEDYTQELINVEKENIALKEKINQLQNTIQTLQLELTEIKIAKNCLEQVTQEIQNKLDINRTDAIQKMRKTIEDLRLELKTLNETSITALREISNQGHEALMQEKVASINLQAKIDNLTKELLESKKQVNEAVTTSQIQIRSLSRQNEQLQTIIKDHGLAKLLQSEELSVQFTKEIAAYGK